MKHNGGAARRLLDHAAFGCLMTEPEGTKELIESHIGGRVEAELSRQLLATKCALSRFALNNPSRSGSGLKPVF